ncbi:hypothetical protein AMAG_13022 [Allomyces macrogynus ATCC 38327]|uniref:Rhodanese domain-containing protein n=1 Tax=Allomyces macrogynus (strain ATCC 38327) TaxID=578462 RepID=A0A0L0T187_ALLM3|nr:hypothetical protein AMAG_13022 [Allomyces macrogynus ATCC 38327]|eukprot:KNE68364.1 hypothetical protein AMAG_13022 [Allomyces macrogynus ATCC 38327]
MSLSNEEIERYGRQMILPNIGRPGQLAIKQASVLVVGTGGLGAPVAMYLACAGIGTLGLVDHDTVAVSNIHRQVIHTEDSVGVPKTTSARKALEKANSHVRYVEHNLLLDASNALATLRPYDVIVDCTDNVPTRYLLNDACVLLGKPLVSGSALRFDGQLTVYHYRNGPCYRCLFPTPPPPETVTNCDDGGVLGPVTGMLGSLQALEVLKMVALGESAFAGRMLLVDGLAGAFRTVKLRGRQKECAVCGDAPTIKELVDYVQFCGARPDDKTKPVKMIPANERITVRDLHARLNAVPTTTAAASATAAADSTTKAASISSSATTDGTTTAANSTTVTNVPTTSSAAAPAATSTADRSPSPVVLLDVRAPVQFGIAHLPNSINVPWRDLPSRLDEVRALAPNGTSLVVLCRRGNDSQRAVAKLREEGIECVDVIGGLEAWSADVDPEFPRY